MKRTNHCLPFLLLLFATFSSCMTFTDFQSAKTVGKGNVEIAPNFTGDFSSDLRFPALGLNVDYGLTNWMDVRASLTVTGITNLVSVAPKVSLLKDHLAFTLPIGTFWAQKQLDIDRVYVLQPTFLLTIPVRETMDFTFAPKWVFLKNQNTHWENPMFAPTFGLSIHRPGSNITYRPEIGFSHTYSKVDVHAGMAVAFQLGKHQ